MAALPAVFPDGQTLERDGPWYLMGLVRRHFRWHGDTRSPMTAFETVLSTVLAYWIVPVTLFFFWVRYLARQDFRGTLLHVFLIAASVASATSLPFVVSRVLRPGDLRLPKSKNVLRLVLRTLRASLAVGCLLFLFSIGVNRGLPYDRSTGQSDSPAEVRRWASMVFQSIGYRPYSDLTEATLSSPPPRGAAWTEETVEKISGARISPRRICAARIFVKHCCARRCWTGRRWGTPCWCPQTRQAQTFRVRICAMRTCRTGL